MSKTKDITKSLNASTASGVTARAIEDWLTNATERSYQTAFCHLLNAMGYSVIHSTTHGPAEEGKDVIVKDMKGKVTAFQLKRGDINVNEWRRIYDQLVELVELPVKHPSVKSKTRHQPVLVTTGFINEHVISRIDGQNKSWRRRSFYELETWSGSELLMKFIRHTGAFIPAPIPEFHRLLGMTVKGGRGQLDKDEFDLILKSILPITEKYHAISKREILSKVKASAVIVEFALASFDKAGNDFAKIEAYVLLICYILALAKRFKIQINIFESTLRIIEDAIDICVKNIWDATKISKPPIDPILETIVGPYRNTITYGVLAAHGLWNLLGGRSFWFSEIQKDLAKEMIKKKERMSLASEAFVSSKFLISEFLRQNGEVQQGDELFKQLLQGSILRKVKGETVKPLWDPYIPIEQAILRDLGKQYDTFLPQTWACQSYSGYALILIAASRLLRQDLQSLWHKITSLIFHEFVPVRDYQILLWNNRKGTMVQKMVPRPSSWADLRKEARDTTDMPRAFLQMQHWLPYFLLVYPHRFAPCRVLALVEALRRRSVQPV